MPAGRPKKEVAEANEYEMDIKANLWRLFYELRELHRALDQMPQGYLLVQNAKERAKVIERCADSLYR